MNVHLVFIFLCQKNKLNNINMKPQTEIPLKFWLYFVVFMIFFLFIGLSDFLIGSLTKLISISESTLFILIAASAFVYALIRTYSEFKRSQK